jgi:MYXO-CTERM domain-containing protein
MFWLAAIAATRSNVGVSTATAGDRDGGDGACGSTTTTATPASATAASIAVAAVAARRRRRARRPRCRSVATGGSEVGSGPARSRNRLESWVSFIVSPVPVEGRLADEVAEFDHAAGVLALDGPDRATEQAGDVALGQVFVVAEDDHRALPGWQREQGLP